MRYSKLETHACDGGHSGCPGPSCEPLYSGSTQSFVTDLCLFTTLPKPKLTAGWSWRSPIWTSWSSRRRRRRRHLPDRRDRCRPSGLQYEPSAQHRLAYISPHLTQSGCVFQPSHARAPNLCLYCTTGAHGSAGGAVLRRLIEAGASHDPAPEESKTRRGVADDDDQDRACERHDGGVAVCR